MKRLSCALFLSLVGCTVPNAVPKLGDRFHLPNGSNQLMVSSAQFWPHQKQVIGGITYDIAANDRNRVAYIATNDPKFRTPEGLGTDSTLEQVLQAGAKQPWAEPGWAYHTKLPSGWSVAFISGLGLTDHPLQSNSKVSWFFKR